MNPQQNQQPSEPTLEDSVAQVMRTLPAPVREYLAQKKYSAAATKLMSKYGLHVDQGGILERELMLLLMGIENPDEFAQSLIGEAALPEDVVRTLMTDVNQEIFIPLQNQIRQGGPEAVKPASPARPTPPAPSYGARPTTPPQAPRPMQPAVTPAPKPTSIPMPASMAQTFSQTPKPPTPQMPSRPANVAPLPPKMAMPVARPVMPINRIQPAPGPMLPVGEEEEKEFRVHRTAPPPVNLPGAVPAQRAPMPEAPGIPPVSKAPPPPVKPYTVDPYREPIE